MQTIKIDHQQYWELEKGDLLDVIHHLETLLEYQISDIDFFVLFFFFFYNIDLTTNPNGLNPFSSFNLSLIQFDHEFMLALSLAAKHRNKTLLKWRWLSKKYTIFYLFFKCFARNIHSFFCWRFTPKIFFQFWCYTYLSLSYFYFDLDMTHEVLVLFQSSIAKCFSYKI